MSSIPTILFTSFSQDGGHKLIPENNLFPLLGLGLHFEMCFNNVVSILNRAYVKKTDDINRVNRARSHTDGEYYMK